jgi:hypothetical protein
MLRTGPKSKTFQAQRYNPYVRQNSGPQPSIFEDVAGNYLRIARGEAKSSDKASDTESNSYEDEHRYQS